MGTGIALAVVAIGAMVYWVTAPLRREFELRGGDEPLRPRPSGALPEADRARLP